MIRVPDETILALSKGELGNEIEKYLKSYGLYVKINNRPVSFVQRVGNRIFRPMRSGDVPRYVAERADYGITGEDMVAEYNINNTAGIRILDKLGFGKGNLVLFSRGDDMKKDTPTVAVPFYYRELLEKGQADKFLRNMFREYNVFEVGGSTEGFVADTTADIGFDFTTGYGCPGKRTTLSENGLKIIENIMPTETVLVARNGYSKEDFDKFLQGPFDIDWKKVNGLVPVIVEDYETNETLMQAYANQNALQATIDNQKATFYSRSRDGLWEKGETSGNTLLMNEILVDCDNDCLLYRVMPNGPVCHTGNRTCFYRKL